MKKIWRILIVMMITIMAMTCTVFAEVNLDINTKGSNVIINGTSDHKNQNVIIQTWNKDKKYYVDVTKTKKDGNFNFKFKTIKDMEFNGSINAGGEIKKFKFTTKPEVKIENLNFIEKHIKLSLGDSKKLQINIVPKNAINEKLIWKSSDKDIVSVSECGEIRAIKEGKAEIEVSNKQGDKKDRCVVVVSRNSSSGGGGGGTSSKPGNEEVTVYMRIEGYDETIVPRTKLKVGLFNLNPYLGQASGSSAEKSSGWDVDKFKEPTNAHAIVKLLNANHIKYDLQDYGWSTYMSMINGDREFDQGPMSGWMYSVNGQLPPVGCNGKPLRHGDEILWFYGAYGFDNIVTTLKADKTKVKAGEEVTLDLEGFRTEGANGKEHVGDYSKLNEKIYGATILVDEEEFKIDGKTVKTDDNGKCKIKFSEDGTYKICATRNKTTGLKKIDIVRPESITIVVGSTSSSGGGGSSAKVEKENEKALSELEKKLDKLTIDEKELNIYNKEGKQIITVGENIISSKVREANNIINKIKDKYKEAKLSEDVNLIPIKIDNKDKKQVVFKLDGATSNYLSNSKFGLNVNFGDSQVKLLSNKISNIKYDDTLEIRKTNMKEYIKSTLQKEIASKEKIVTPSYNIELYKISSDVEEKLDLKGIKIGLKVDNKQLKNISKKSLKIRIYDNKEKKLKMLKSNYITRDGMVIAEVK